MGASRGTSRWKMPKTHMGHEILLMENEARMHLLSGPFDSRHVLSLVKTKITLIRIPYSLLYREHKYASLLCDFVIL